VASDGRDLNTEILAAHAKSNYFLLIDLYTKAANLADNQDAECFFLTLAYVFALELGHPHQFKLQARPKGLWSRIKIKVYRIRDWGAKAPQSRSSIFSLRY
tara:strand:- start:4153 stop:4455 length:303 start_codon:yes stop_codon:yes gene_type:complete